MSALKLKTIGVVVGPQKPDAIAVVRELRAWCEQQGVALRAVEPVAEQVACPPLSVRDDELTEPVDLIVVLGGDGTMLGAARLVGARRIPVLGVNFGWLGYLTEFTLAELFPALDGWRAGHFDIDHRMVIEVSLKRGSQTIETRRALNDAVINQSSRARMIEFDCYVNEHFVNSFRADGMIVATPDRLDRLFALGGRADCASEHVGHHAHADLPAHAL